MKESISYTFILNIVILFIFICAAIIMGIFSYYRAFKANTIIVNTIEKYEGYNCVSDEEIARKLNTISYNVPFNVECKDSYGKPCMTDSNNNYAIISYNIDYASGEYVEVAKEKNYEKNSRYAEMNSQYSCGDIFSETCENTKKYQYGVYTYMYVDVPVINNLIKIPFFSKTKTMYEFRNIYENENGNPYDSRNIYNLERYSGQYITLIPKLYSTYVLDAAANELIGNPNGFFIRLDLEYNARKVIQYIPKESTDINVTVDDGVFIQQGYPYECGYIRDYSLY